MFPDTSVEVKSVFEECLMKRLVSITVNIVFRDWIHALLSCRKSQSQFGFDVRNLVPHRDNKKGWEKMDEGAAMFTTYVVDILVIASEIPLRLIIYWMNCVGLWF